MSSDAGIDEDNSESESEASVECPDESEQLLQLVAKLKTNYLFRFRDQVWAFFLIGLVCVGLPLLLAILDNDFISGPRIFTRDPSKPAHAEYCNSFLPGSFMPLLSLEANEEIQCRLCPDNARCQDGHILRCHEGYIMTHALCVDSNDVNLVLALRMLPNVIHSLRVKAGAVECADPSSGSFERGVTEEDFPAFVDSVAQQMGIAVEDDDLDLLQRTLWNLLTPNPDDYGLLTGEWIVPDVLDATLHSGIVAPGRNALRTFRCRVYRYFAWLYIHPIRPVLLGVFLYFMTGVFLWAIRRKKIEVLFYEIRATPSLRSSEVAEELKALFGVQLPVEGMSPVSEPRHAIED